MATLPVDADSTPNYTSANHATHHNTIHGLWNTLTTAGDLLVATGAQAYARLAKGNALDVLRVNAGGTALEWAAPSGTTAWTDYTPTLTQSATVTKTMATARYVQIGKIVHVVVRLQVTGAGTASNAIVVGLPVTGQAANVIVGTGFVYDSSAGSLYKGIVNMVSTTTLQFYGTIDSTLGSIGNGGGMTAALASGDEVQFHATYEAA